MDLEPQSEDLELCDLYIRGRVFLDSGLPASPDVLGGLLEFVRVKLSCDQKRISRNHLIRRAALIIDGTPWHKAATLNRERKALTRTQNMAAGSVAEFLKNAAELYPLPRCQRVFYRILTGKSN